MTWTYLLHLKSDSFVIIQSFIQTVYTQYSTSIKHIRSDNGFEFFNQHCSSLFVSKGIIHQSSCVHTPQKNGLVERKHRRLLKVARDLKFQAQIPLKYCGDCLLTSTYLINRLPTQVLSSKSPFECFHGHSPSLDHIRTMVAYVMTLHLITPKNFPPNPSPQSLWDTLTLRTATSFLIWKLAPLPIEI